MKKLCTLLAALLLLSLAACGGSPETEDPISAEPWEPFAYEIMISVGYSHETYAEDGTLVCSCHHEIPKLLPSGEQLTATQQASVDAFHAAMDEVLAGSRLLYDELSETALMDYDYMRDVGLEWGGHYTDEMTYTCVYNARAISLNFAGYTHSGGPHPGVGNVCCLFDLEAGVMVGLSEITDDEGAAFRAAIGEEILRQVEEQGLAEQYYDDYEATARAQDEVEYYFREDGLTAYFPNYTLGPYAAGYPSFEIPADVFGPTLNERGQTLLNLT